MLGPALGIIPLLVFEIFAGMLAGAVGLSLIASPGLKPVAKKVEPSIGIILADHPSGPVSGTAFAVDPAMAVTSYHVVAGTSQLRVKFPKSAWLQPAVLAVDQNSDLAVLGIADTTVPPIPLGDPSPVRAGDHVLALGFPTVAAATKRDQKMLVMEATVKSSRDGVLVFQPAGSFESDGGPVINSNAQVIAVARGAPPNGRASTVSAVTVGAVRPLLAEARERRTALAAPPPPQVQPSPSNTPQQTSPPPSPTVPSAAPAQPPAELPAQPQEPPAQTHSQNAAPPPQSSSPQAPAQSQLPVSSTPPSFQVVAPSSPPAPPQQQPQAPPAPPTSPQTPSQGAGPPQKAPAPTVRPQPPVQPPTPPQKPPPAQPQHQAATPAAKPPSTTERFVVVPGNRIGPIRLGVRVQDLESVLGPPAATNRQGDGAEELRWYKPPKNDGIGVRVTKDGTVDRIWAVNDTRYVTEKNLRIGSTEAEVRAALGPPSNVVIDNTNKNKILLYRQLGLWFFVQLDSRLLFYDHVYEIGVIGR